MKFLGISLVLGWFFSDAIRIVSAPTPDIRALLSALMAIGMTALFMLAMIRARKNP